MKNLIALLIVASALTGCVNSDVKLAVWRSSTIDGKSNESTQEFVGGGEVDTTLPIR